MEVIVGLENLTKNYDNVCLALGTFDGIHQGHKKLIKKAVKKARETNGTSIVMSFCEHPQTVLKNQKKAILLNNDKEKIHLLKMLGVDIHLMIHFTEEFKSMTAEEFVVKIIEGRLNAKNVFVGFNYTFGAGGSGKPDLLVSMGKKLGVGVHVVNPVKIENRVVSSTLIREYVSNGDMAKAEEYLGYPFIIIGEVVHGKKYGRKMGFPTANLKIYNKIYPPVGIYGVEVVIEGEGKVHHGVMNIGVNPTLKPGEFSVEAHILDFDRDIYDKELLVKVKKFIREERKFNSMEELKATIENDVLVWKDYLKNIGV